jgi:predicted ATPase
MAFAISGCHRSGKTTLAKQVSEALGMHYFDASTTKLMAEFGINAVGDIPLEQRVEAQEFLLKRYLQNLQKAPRPLITDRTPLDMIGYMLGEITMHNSSVELGERVNKYVDQCLDEAIRHFDTVIIVGPLASYTADPKSPPPNLGYQRCVQLLIEGAASLVEPHMYVSRLDTTHMDDRRDLACQIIYRRMGEIAAQSKQIVHH